MRLLLSFDMDAQILLDIVKAMHTYQKKNGVTQQCFTNVQYLAHQCRLMFLNKIEAIPVFMTHISDDKNLYIWNGGHIVLSVEGIGILDPSYETSHLQGTNYFSTMKDLLEAIPHMKENKEFCKQSIERYVVFKNYTNMINNESKIFMNKEYYQAQAEYVKASLVT